MASPCTNDPNEVISAVIGIQTAEENFERELGDAVSVATENADKYDAFVNGTDTQTVQLGEGSPTPTIRNTVRQMMSAASELPNADVSGKSSTANGGSIMRTLAERFADIVNVKDYGAKGDGTTDDYASIQAAFDAAAEMDSASIYFPEGTYFISTGISIPGNIYVNAEKAKFTRDKSTCLGFVSNRHGISSTAGEGVDGYEGNGNIHWNGGVFYGDSKDNDSINFQFMSFGHARNITVENCIFHDHCGPGHAVELAGVENVVIKNCSFLGYNPTYLSDGEETTNESWKEAIQFEPVTTGGYWFANYDFTPTRNVTIESCVFGPSIESSLGAHLVAVGTHWTAILDSGEPPVHDIVVTNCSFDSIQKVAIRNLGIERFVISNNTFHNCGRVLRLTRMSASEAQYQDGTAVNKAIACKNLLFTNNIISDDAENTYIVIDCENEVNAANVSTDTVLNEDIEISNNQFTRPPHVYGSIYHYLFKIGSAKNLKIEGNISKWYTEIGINLSSHCEDVLIANNMISCFTEQGIVGWDSHAHKNVNVCNNFISGDFVSNTFASQPIRFQGVDGLNIIGNYVKSIITKSGTEKNAIEITTACKRGLIASNVIDTQNTGSSVYDIKTASTNVDVALGPNVCLNSTGGGTVYSDSGTKNSGRGLVRGSATVVRENSAKYGTLYKNAGFNNPPAIAGLLSSGGVLTFGLASESSSETLLALHDSNDGGVPSLRPVANNGVRLGSGSASYSAVYVNGSSITSSDERLKDNIVNPSEALMKAWGKVNFKVFQFKEAMESKGGGARLHVGVIAQRIKEAFASEGIDAERYGLFCYDEWGDEFEEREVVDTEATYDEQGNIITPEVKHIERVQTQAAGSKYSVRYEEALALECAYQRWLGEKRDARIAELEARLNEISGNLPAPSGASPDNL